MPVMKTIMTGILLCGVLSAGCGGFSPAYDNTDKIKTVCEVDQLNGVFVDFDTDCEHMRAIYGLAVESIRPVIGYGPHATDFLSGVVIRVEDVCSLNGAACGSEYAVTGYGEAGFIFLNSDMASLAHEMLHVHDDATGVLDTGSHPHWDTNGNLACDRSFRAAMTYNHWVGRVFK